MPVLKVMLITFYLIKFYYKTEGLMALLRDMGAAYQQLAQYNCARAIDLLTALPTQHYRTGWVLSHIGKAHFEMNNYQQAVK